MIRSDSPVSLVSISAGRARVLRWRDGEVIQVDLPSDVPGRHRSTGHVRHDPMVRHGGSGPGQDEVERQRTERIGQFLARVIDALHGDERVLVLGSGRLPRELAERLQQAEHGRPRPRAIELERTGFQTDRQLRARLLAWSGHPARRRHAPPRPQVGRLRRNLGRTPSREKAAEREELEALDTGGAAAG